MIRSSPSHGQLSISDDTLPHSVITKDAAPSSLNNDSKNDTYIHYKNIENEMQMLFARTSQANVLKLNTSRSSTSFTTSFDINTTTHNSHDVKNTSQHVLLVSQSLPLPDDNENSDVKVSNIIYSIYTRI